MNTGYLDFSFLLYDPQFDKESNGAQRLEVKEATVDPKRGNGGGVSTTKKRNGAQRSLSKRGNGAQRSDKGTFTVALSVAQREEVIAAYFSRKEQGLTIPLIAAAMGVSKRTITNIVAAHKKSLADKAAAEKEEKRKMEEASRLAVQRTLDEAAAKKKEAERIALEKKIAAEEEARDKQRLHFKKYGDTDY